MPRLPFPPEHNAFFDFDQGHWLSRAAVNNGLLHLLVFMRVYMLHEVAHGYFSLSVAGISSPSRRLVFPGTTAVAQDHENSRYECIRTEAERILAGAGMEESDLCEGHASDARIQDG